MAGGAADDEAGLDDALFGMVAGERAFDQADEDVGRLLAHLGTSLLHRREHRVTHRGAETVGEAADAHVVGDSVTQTLHHREDADGCLVVDGKEGIGAVFHAHHGWRDALGVGAVVADAHQRLVHCQAVLVQRIAVAVVTVLADNQIHRCAEERYALASRADQMRHRIQGAHVIIHYHAAGIDGRADAIIEHQRHSGCLKMHEVVILIGVIFIFLHFYNKLKNKDFDDNTKPSFTKNILL